MSAKYINPGIVSLSEEKAKLLDEFKKALDNITKPSDRLSFIRSFDAPDSSRKATLYFMETAWYKMQALVMSTDKEIAWHGVVTRGENDEYYVHDIVVYPQEVTGGTVNTDQEAYQTWLMELDDETFNHLRFQGHSHVTMGVTPSGVDTTYYDQLLENIKDVPGVFQIFMVINKKGDKWIKIMDYEKNLCFETADVIVKLKADDLGIETFAEEARKMVKERVYTPPAPASTYGGSYYGGSNYYNGASKNPPAAPPATAAATTTAAGSQSAKPAGAVIPLHGGANAKEGEKGKGNASGKKGGSPATSGKERVTVGSLACTEKEAEYDQQIMYGYGFDGYDPEDPYSYSEKYIGGK